jgi:hypothetical protein
MNRTVNGLAERIRSEAAIASRAGQYDSLNQIADEVDDALLAAMRTIERLVAERARLRADVEALAGHGLYVREHSTVWLHEVLDLIDGVKP